MQEGCPSAGKAKYDSKKHALVWKIKRFTGATEHSLVSAVELIATTREKKSWSRPPISMTFQVLPPGLRNCKARTNIRDLARTLGLHDKRGPAVLMSGAISM